MFANSPPSAVKYYLKNDFSMEYVCDIFECKKQSLSRWVDRYLLENSIKRHNRLPISYRDCNGATNIYKIAFNSIHKRDRPSYLCRNNKSGVLDDTSKPKFTRID